MVLGSGIRICKQVNCNLEGKLYVPMDSIKRIREDSIWSCELEFGAVHEFVRIRGELEFERIRANSNLHP